MALHLDFKDWRAHDAYGVDPVHDAASAFNESVAWEEVTTRVDWFYDGPRLTQRGHVRNVAMIVWDDDATGPAKQKALDAARRLEVGPGVETLTIGECRSPQDRLRLDPRHPDARRRRRAATARR